MKQGILVRWRGTVHIVHGRTPTGLVKIWDGKQMRSARRDNLKFVTKPYKVKA